MKLIEKYIWFFILSVNLLFWMGTFFIISYFLLV
ncbi:Uncharacterised protein [Serratia plymuthica]|nr:Uncharacterised protein [Serratia plymuthica]